MATGDRPEPTSWPASTPERGGAPRRSSPEEAKGGQTGERPAAPPPAGTDPDGARPPLAELTTDQALRPDELAVLRRDLDRPGRTGGRVLGLAWPPPTVALIVAVITVVGLGLGAAMSRWPGPTAEAPANRVVSGSTGPSAATPPTAPPTTAAARAPAACRDAARYGDQTVSLLKAGVRGWRLDRAVVRYNVASQACRRATQGR